MKSHSLEHILSLPEETIAELYPHGATLQPDKRWIPAEHDLHGMGHRTLGDLIADKRRRLIPDRYLGKQAGYVTDPVMGLRQEPASIDRETQERYSDEARARRADGELAESLAELEGRRQAIQAQLDGIRRVMDRHDVNAHSAIRVAERQLDELERKLGGKRAA